MRNRGNEAKTRTSNKDRDEERTSDDPCYRTETQQAEDGKCEERWRDETVHNRQVQIGNEEAELPSPTRKQQPIAPTKPAEPLRAK